MATILLAEDEPILRMLVMDSLEDEGYDIEVACDGQEAFDKILARDFDLVILDYMMPRMTGIEVIERMRELPERMSTKILMLSAKSQQSEQDKVFSSWSGRIHVQAVQSARTGGQGGGNVKCLGSGTDISAPA